MASSVFVLDAHGQPLMPLAAAHARRLLQSGKARPVQHPLFSILQLTRVVEQPILRPILLAVAIHRTTAELFVIAEGARAILPLLYIIVDLQAVRQPLPERRTQQHKRLHGKGNEALRALLAAVGALLTFVPISSAIILSSSRRYLSTSHLNRRLKHYLLHAKQQVFFYHHQRPVPLISPVLSKTLTDFVGSPTTHSTTIVARPIPARGQRAQLLQLLGGLSHPPDLTIGKIASPPATGLILDSASSDARVLSVAIQAGRSGVLWQDVSIPSTTTVQTWPVSDIAFVPLFNPRSSFREE